MKKWTMPLANWALTISQLAVMYEGRFDLAEVWKFCHLHRLFYSLFVTVTMAQKWFTLSIVRPSEYITSTVIEATFTSFCSHTFFIYKSVAAYIPPSKAIPYRKYFHMMIVTHDEKLLIYRIYNRLSQYLFCNLLRSQLSRSRKIVLRYILNPAIFTDLKKWSSHQRNLLKNCATNVTSNKK
jgi:hypothetical protein